jgi:hypothetical protein
MNNPNSTAFIPCDIESETLAARQSILDYPDKYSLHHVLGTFSITDKRVREKLDKYFLLYWEPKWFKQNLSGFDKTYIRKDGINYFVIYQQSLHPAYLDEYVQLRVSFRKLIDMDMGIVLVRGIRPSASMKG